MKKIIKIQNLMVDTQIGVYDHEKQRKQRLFISLELEVDFSAAMQSDDLNHTLDYAHLSATISELLMGQHFELIERIAGVIANLLETQFAIKRYSIEVSKPSALLDAESVAVFFSTF